MKSGEQGENDTFDAARGIGVELRFSQERFVFVATLVKYERNHDASEDHDAWRSGEDTIRRDTNDVNDVGASEESCGVPGANVTVLALLEGADLRAWEVPPKSWKEERHSEKVGLVG